MLAYAAFAFASKLTANHTKRLNKVQILALRLTCNARKGTPLKGMEIILDIPPIDLFLEAEALKSTHRLIGSSDETQSKDGHLQTRLTKLKTLGIDTQDRGDYIGKHLSWQNK